MRGLERRALDWIEPYWNVDHLVRTRDWARELEPSAGEGLVLAALTHDIERHFPGGPIQDLSNWPESESEREYRRLHSERSARIVCEWLQAQAAGPQLISTVEELILVHETGGFHAADVLQAADSISFLEVNVEATLRWVREGRCGPERAKAQHAWMFERIRLPGAQELARAFYERALETIDAEAAAA